MDKPLTLSKRMREWIDCAQEVEGYAAELSQANEQRGRRSDMANKPKCPNCGSELIHAGMSIPVYDCAQCDKEWLVADSCITEVTEGCAHKPQ